MIYRAAVFNQIYNTTYHRVTAWEAGKTGWRFSKVVCGHRGPGGNLGMKGTDAIDHAAYLNLTRSAEERLKDSKLTLPIWYRERGNK